MAKRRSPFVVAEVEPHKRYVNALRWMNVHKKKLDFWTAEVQAAHEAIAASLQK